MLSGRVIHQGQVHAAMPHEQPGQIRLDNGLVCAQDQVQWLVPFEVGTIIAFGRLTADSEAVAMRAAGLPVRQMLRAPLALGALAALFLLASDRMEVDPSLRPTGSRFGLHKSKGVVARLSALFAVDSFASGVIPMSLVIYWIHIRFGVPEIGLGGISLGFNFLTGGSRSAFSGSMALVEAAKQIKADLCARACKLWEARPEQVEWKDGVKQTIDSVRLVAVTS